MSPAAQKVADATAAWKKNPTRETNLARLKAVRAFHKTAEYARQQVQGMSWERMMSE